MASAVIKEDADDMTLKDVEENCIRKQREMLQRLYAIWNNAGVGNGQQVDRANQVWGYVFDLLEEILEKEIGLNQEIEKRVKNYEKKILGLLDELALPKSEEIEGTLTIREEALRQQLDELTKMKHKRLKEFQELHSVELNYCKMLGMPTPSLSSTTGVPSEKDIYELKEHVNMLKQEKDHRQKRFYVLKKELSTILEVTELIPQTPLEREILTSEDDNLSLSNEIFELLDQIVPNLSLSNETFELLERIVTNPSLSNETFELLEQIVTKTKFKKVELENEKAALMDKNSKLWDVLKIEKDEETFLSKHKSCSVSSLNAIKEEIARCESIKKQNIKKYVEALKEELSSLWKKCFISNSELHFKSFESDEVEEAVLESYDNEIAKWKKYYKDTQHIIQKIQKRQELLDLMTIFENKSNDPNRFKNRGGNLLQEERERKKLQKDLPALENEIFLDIEKYEEESGKRFLYSGENFKDFVTKQWDNRTAQKENERQIRQKLRARQLEDERTPLKSPFATTPKSAPSKFFKSSVSSPNVPVARKVPCTTAKMRTTLLRTKQNSDNKARRNVLRGKNVNNAESSTSHDTTTYTDFAKKLNRSSSYANRSSVLSSRKIVGTRISANKSERKSGNVSTRKSLGKKGSTTRITPVRGKLGLPFLM